MDTSGDAAERFLIPNAGGLRALAHELLGDAHAAEDVLQDTFVRALVSPPPDRSSSAGVRAWLRGVTRGLASNRRRDDAHRRERESRYARERSKHDDAHEASEERGRVLRAVVDAVLALDEPYRSTVLARYFEGAAPSAIASRSGVPVATVASRLQRAHQKLRERLERELGPDEAGRGGLTHALLLLVRPWDASPAAHALVAKKVLDGALLMSTKTVVATGALALAGLLVALFLWNRETSAEHAELARDAARTDSERGVERSTLDATTSAAARSEALATEDPARAAAASSASSSAWSAGAGPYAFELELVVLDEMGRAMPLSETYGAPWGQPLADLGSTTWNGANVVRWRAFEPEIELVVRASRSGRGRSDLRRVVAHAGARERVVLPLVGAVADVRKGEVRLRVAALSLSSGEHVGWWRATADEGGSSFSLDADGNGVFVDPFLDPIEAPKDVPILSGVPVVGSFFRARAAHLVALDARRADRLDLVFSGASIVAGESAPAEPEATCRVEGTLRAANGGPARDAPVLLATEKNTGAFETRTDENGAFAFDATPVGAAIVYAGGPGFGLATQNVALEPGRAKLELRLDDRGTLFVRLVDENGTALPNWRVEAWNASERDLAGASITDGEGRVTLCDVAGAPFRVLARPMRDVQVPAALVAAGVWPQKEELTLAVRGATKLASVKVDLASATNVPSDRAEVRLWREDRAFGVKVDALQATENEPDRRGFGIGGLVPGRYVIEAGARGETWTEIATFELEPGQELDLGVHRFGPRAELEARFVVDDATGVASAKEPVRERAKGSVFVRRRGTIVCSDPFDLELPATFSVPAGDARLEWTRHPLARVVRDAPAEVLDGDAASEPRAEASFEYVEQGTPRAETITGVAGRRSELELVPLPRAP